MPRFVMSISRIYPFLIRGKWWIGKSPFWRSDLAPNLYWSIQNIETINKIILIGVVFYH